MKSPWSISLVKVAGTEVRAHITFLILLAWIGSAYWKEEGPAVAVGGVLLICGVFFCVLLHEFGHVFAARRYGISTPRITLLPIGGLASLSRIPRRPVEELVVALAGPAVNVCIAALLLLLGRIAPGWDLPIVVPELVGKEGGGYLEQLLWVNLVLVVFNLVPAFPMDGGRVFRAFLAMFMSREAATRIAAALGQTIAVFGGIYAFGAGQPILALIAVFIFLAAGAEAQLVRSEFLLEGLQASDASMGEFHALGPGDALGRAEHLLLDGSQVDFPVVDDLGVCVGVLTRDRLLAGLVQEGEDGQVASFALGAVASVGEDMPAALAWQKLQESQMPGVAVVDGSGRLRGWLTAENLRELLLVREARAHAASHR
jgi:stage IV sporulation protein FB